MSGHPDVGTSARWRQVVGDPLVPALLMVVGAVAAAWYGPVLTWAIIGGLAGYSLSGSV